MMPAFVEDEFGLREMKLAVTPEWAGGTIGLQPSQDYPGALCMWAGYVDGYSILTQDEARTLADELLTWANTPSLPVNTESA